MPSCNARTGPALREALLAYHPTNPQTGLTCKRCPGCVPNVGCEGSQPASDAACLLECFKAQAERPTYTLVVRALALHLTSPHSKRCYLRDFTGDTRHPAVQRYSPVTLCARQGGLHGRVAEVVNDHDHRKPVHPHQVAGDCWYTPGSVSAPGRVMAAPHAPCSMLGGQGRRLSPKAP